ncbi:MAG TPA: FAD-dependent oxidoreductase [Candidatus Polarisedimenticolia bacterium]|jgi:D-arginine dehydrogenase
MILIVGGGYAGAATAWALARRGLGRDVVLLDAEPRPGAHASGRNAGLLAALLEEDPAMAAMSARGAQLLHESFGTTRCGSILLVPDARAAQTLLDRAAELGVKAEASQTSTLAREIPVLAGTPSPLGVRCPADAKLEPAALLESYLDAARRAGARVVAGARVTAVVTRGGRAAGVETTSGRFDADRVVNAAGAWAGPLGTMAGLTDLGLVPYRRHLFISAPMAAVGPSWPFVWDLERQTYFRPDAPRLMLCMCDEEPHPPSPPEVVAQARTRMEESIRVSFPALTNVTIEDQRACLRTFAPDRRYVIGPDPRMPGFFWVAGLGGSGVVAGAAIGEMAADLLLDRDAGGPGPGRARDFDPSRLIGFGG